MRAVSKVGMKPIGQAAYHFAAMHGTRFSVVTTLEVSVPILSKNIESYGLSAQCARVRASGVEVLALEQSPDEANATVLAEVQRAEQEDKISSIALGCGSMVHLLRLIRENTSLHPIDGVRAATAFCRSWVASF